MNKEDVIHIYNGILAICSNMDGLKRLSYCEVIQKEKRQVSYVNIYMWNLEYDTNGLIYRTV